MVGGGAGRRAITGQLRSVIVRKRKTYKNCRERPGQLYDARERPGEADEMLGGRGRREEVELGEQQRLCTPAKLIAVRKWPVKGWLYIQKEQRPPLLP